MFAEEAEDARRHEQIRTDEEETHVVHVYTYRHTLSAMHHRMRMSAVCYTILQNSVTANGDSNRTLLCVATFSLNKQAVKADSDTSNTFKTCSQHREIGRSN